MSQSKARTKSEGDKTPLHYRLTNEEWLKVLHDLKPAEIAVYLYLRTLAPFCDITLDLTITDIAETLGLHKSTISRALQVLKAKGYIDLEITSARVRLRNRIQPVAPQLENTVVSKQQVLSPSNKTDCDATNEVPVQQSRSIGNKPSLKPLPTNTSGGSQTIHTDHTPQTLSQAEREEQKLYLTEDGDPTPEFRAWLMRKASELPNRPALIERWIESQALIQANQRDFLKQQDPREDKDPLRFSFGEKFCTADSADILRDKILLCKRALDEGDRGRVLVILQSLWKDGRDEGREICNQFPDWGFEVGQDGPRDISGNNKVHYQNCSV